MIEVYKIIATNGLRMSDDGALGKRQPTFAQMLNRITNVEFTTVRPAIATNDVGGSFSSARLFSV